MRTTMASAAGNMSAPPAPWTTRKATIHASAALPLGVSPHMRRGGGEDDHAEHAHAAVAEDVGQPATQGEQCGQREQVAVHHPLDAGRGEASSRWMLGTAMETIV